MPSQAIQRDSPACRMPAEWEPHRACWVAYPFREDEWGEMLPEAQREWMAMCEAIMTPCEAIMTTDETAAGETAAADASGISGIPGVVGALPLPPERLEVIVPDERTRAMLAERWTGYHLGFHLWPYGDAWTRDTTPCWLVPTHQEIEGADGAWGASEAGLRQTTSSTTLSTTSSTAPTSTIGLTRDMAHAQSSLARPRMACFGFNGWGGKYLMPGDDALAARMATLWPEVACQTMPLVGECGGIESNGQGVMLTTDTVFCNPNRNPNATRAAVNGVFSSMLGADTVGWMRRGLLGDHTDGHIDNIVRFVDPWTVVAVHPTPQDPNEEAHAAIREDLMAMRQRGAPLRIVWLPSAGDVRARSGESMPASYCNFYIGNASVVVPMYGHANDAYACEVLGGLFPTRRVVGVSAHALLHGGGSVHCMTRDEPLAFSQLAGPPRDSAPCARETT